MCRTASIGSQVGPAVTRISRPASACSIPQKFFPRRGNHPRIPASKSAICFVSFSTIRRGPVPHRAGLFLAPGVRYGIIQAGELLEETTPMAVIQSLAEVPLFSGLGAQDLAVIGERVRQRRYRDGDTIFRRDDPGVALYIIVSGKVKIHNQLP